MVGIEGSVAPIWIDSQPWNGIEGLWNLEWRVSKLVVLGLGLATGVKLRLGGKASDRKCWGSELNHKIPFFYGCYSHLWKGVEFRGEFRGKFRGVFRGEFRGECPGELSGSFRAEYRGGVS